MKSKNPNCGAAGNGLAPQSCMSDGFVIKQLDDLRTDIDELNRVFKAYESGQAIHTQTSELDVTKKATIKEADIGKLSSKEAVITSIDTDKISTPLIDKKHIEGIAIENARQTICTFRGSARIDIKLDVLPEQSEISKGVQYISLRVNDGIVSAMSTDPFYANTVEFYRQDDGSVAVFINNLLRDAKNDVIVLRASLFAEAEELKVNVAESYRDLITSVKLIKGISVSGSITVDNTDAITFTNIDVTNLNVANKLRLGDYLLEYPENTKLKVPAGKTLYFWLSDGILKVKNSPMLLRFANSKIIEAIGDPNYILSRPNAPTNSTGVLIKRADGKEFDMSGEMAFYNTNVSQPFNFDILDDDSAFEPVVISKDGIHFLGRNVGAGSAIFNNVVVNDIADIDTVTAGDITSETGNFKTLDADKAKINELSINDINYDNQISAPDLLSGEFYYLKIAGLDTGTFNIKVVGNLRKETQLSLTIIRNHIYSANTIVSYATDNTNNFSEIAEDLSGNIYLKLRYSEATIYWGHAGISDTPVPQQLDKNITPAGLIHTHEIKKLNHTIILGDGSNDYGVEIDGEVLATLIPMPGVTSFEDVAISNTLSVSGKTSLQNDLQVNGKSNFWQDVKLGQYEVDDTLLNPAKLHVSGETTIGTETDPADLKVARNVSIGSEKQQGDLYINGNIYQKGEPYETHAQQFYTKDDMIITREPQTPETKPIALQPGELTGIKALHYDDDGNNGILAFDNKGVARVGDEGDEKPIAVRDEADKMKFNHIAAWEGHHEDSGLGEDKLFTPDNNTIVEGFVRKAETHEAINIKDLGLDINSLDKNADVFGNIYTGLGNDWAVQENLPEEARGSVGFCLEVLPNSHNVIHVYTINKPSGAITWKRRFDNNIWSDWVKVADAIDISNVITGKTPVEKIAENAVDSKENKIVAVKGELADEQGIKWSEKDNIFIPASAPISQQKILDIAHPLTSGYKQIAEEHPMTLFNGEGFKSYWNETSKGSKDWQRVEKKDYKPEQITKLGPGRNLLEVLGATDLKDACAKLKQRVIDRDYSGLMLRDYIDLPSLDTGSRSGAGVIQNNPSWNNLRFEIAGSDFYDYGGDLTNFGILFVAKEVLFKYRMNPTDTSSGGYLGSELYPIVNEDLTKGIAEAIGFEPKEIHRSLDNGYRSSTVNWSTEKVFIPNEMEMFGSWIYGMSVTPKHPNTQNIQQIPLYQKLGNNAGRIKNFEGSVWFYWEASSYKSSVLYFAMVNLGGNANSSNARAANVGVSPAFYIG